MGRYKFNISEQISVLCLFFENMMDGFILNMDLGEIESKLENLAKDIYIDAIKDEKRNYKAFEQMLNSVYAQKYSQFFIQHPKIRILLANGYYNLAKITNRPKYIEITLQLTKKCPAWVLWNLQMIALTSARGNHQQAHKKAVEVIQVTVALIEELELEEKFKLFVREIKELLTRKISLTNITNEQMFKEFQTGPKFKTKCPLISKKFHIADIMAMEALEPELHELIGEDRSQNIFYLYVVYLSIACFTRATQKFYCHETSEKDFHFKAIEIASYLYEQKSTYLRFLYRTFFQHYKQTLEKIDEEEDRHQLCHKIEKDPKEINMTKMPWDLQEEEEIEDSSSLINELSTSKQKDEDNKENQLN